MIRASEMKHRVSAKQGYTDTAPFAVQRVDGEKERRALKLLNKLDDDELNFLAGLESGELSQFIASKFAQKRVMRESYAPKTSTKLALCEERAMHERAASAMHDPRREYGDECEYEGFDDDEDAGRERAEYIYAESLREAEPSASAKQSASVQSASVQSTHHSDALHASSLAGSVRPISSSSRKSLRLRNVIANSNVFANSNTLMKRLLRCCALRSFWAKIRTPHNKQCTFAIKKQKKRKRKTHKVWNDSTNRFFCFFLHIARNINIYFIFNRYAHTQ
jgi:hypothetical protein